MEKVCKAKRILAKTFIEMIGESSMGEIRVADICKRAELDRKTFYNHFMDKYDLAAWIYDMEFSTAFYNVDESIIIDKELLISRTINLYKEMLKEPKRSYYRKVLSDYSQNAVPHYILDNSRTFNETVLKEYLGTDKLTEEQEIAIIYYGNGLFGLTQALVFGKLGITPEVCVRYQYKMVPDFLLEASIAFCNKHRKKT